MNIPAVDMQRPWHQMHAEDMAELKEEWAKIPPNGVQIIHNH